MSHQRADTRSILTRPPVEPVRMHDGSPVLEPLPGSSWQSRVVLNAAAVLIQDAAELTRIFDALQMDEDQRAGIESAGGACILLYRAQGAVDPEKGMAPSSLGLAVLTPDLVLVYRHPDPVIAPIESFQNLGVEDARCTKVGDTWYLFYTGYSRPAGADASTPGSVRICVATTRNFVEWKLLGPVDGEINDVDNKNPALFPEQVGGRWYLLHRPMSGKDAMTIHLASSDAPAGPYRSLGLFFQSFPYEEFAKSWIGAGGPPVAIGDGRFVVIYHQGHFDFEGKREYDLAAALVDLRAAPTVVSRIEPLMRPTAEAEQVGDPDLGVDNVLFTCACYRWKDDLIIPYAGADSRIFGASIPFDELVDALETLRTNE